MRIINVLEIKRGIISKIESFPIFEDQLSEEVTKKAELFFIDKINENIAPEVLSDEEQETHIEDGFYQDRYGYEVYLSWSNVN
jgi:hypothetical protein